MAVLCSGVARLQSRDQCQLHGKVRFASPDINNIRFLGPIVTESIITRGAKASFSNLCQAYLE